MMMEARRQLLCNSRGCKFMKCPDKGNNGGTHCCFKCKRDGAGNHGGQCKKHKIQFMKCNGLGCHYMKNADVFNNGGTHCCKHCKEGKPEHGGMCTQLLVGRGAEAKVDEECASPGCQFMKNPDKNNNGGMHCCFKCKRDGQGNHGDQCKKVELVLVVGKCSTRGCKFMRYPDKSNNGGTHCCFKCKRDGVGQHGDVCMKVSGVCNTRGCRFLKHPDRSNNGGSHCCFRCKKDGVGHHGIVCLKVEERVEIFGKCITRGCKFMKHPDKENNGGMHCCFRCKRDGDGKHGVKCMKVEEKVEVECVGKCITRGCKFLKHPEKSNNGGMHCCFKCKNEGSGKHGGQCLKVEEKLDVEIVDKCITRGCKFMKHPNKSNNGGMHCCFRCKKDGDGKHGAQCKKVEIVEILEEFQGVDYPGHDIKDMPCGSLLEARAIAKREIGGNKHMFAAFCKHRKKIWIKNHAGKNHPSVKKGKVDHNITLFYLKALFGIKDVATGFV